MSQHPRKDAPNVVVVVLDDLGFAQFGCFGSDICTPTVDRLAAGGLRYNSFHVTGMCSPTRAALLTGRNHHSVDMGFLADLPASHPGYTARIPRSAAALPRLLRDCGWSTMAVGKWHLTPRGERSGAGPFGRWPLGLGFERFYGFLRGDANPVAPELVRDNSFVEPPAEPQHGYRLTEDLADEAIRMVLSQQAGAPGKPFFLYFAPGALRSSHQLDQSWADEYVGRFDDGWDRWRDESLIRQVALGIVPETTTVTPRPPWVPAWDDLSRAERRLYARMHEVYAGFVSHTDAQIGRLIDVLERTGVLDNTLILVLSDNAAGAQGGVGPWGWAWAGNTPFRLWKRHGWVGGSRVPLIAHWPKHIRDYGGTRAQFAHAIDLVPTVLDACTVDAPEVVDGVTQSRLHGASLLATFADPAAPDPRSVQYFEMLGSRSIFADGWKATTDHDGVKDAQLLLPGDRDLDEDRWSLFRLDEDFSESRDVASEHPEVLERLKQQWSAEAEANNVLPLCESLIDRLSAATELQYPRRVTLSPGGGPVSDEALPLLVGGGRIMADAEVADTGAGGVLFAIGDRNGGLVAYAIGGQLKLAVALPRETLTLQSDQQLPPGAHRLGCVLKPVSGGVRADLVVDDAVVASGSAGCPLPFVWQHGGSQLTLGYDRGLPVCDDYLPPFGWNGALRAVTVEAGPFEITQPDLMPTAARAD